MKLAAKSNLYAAIGRPWPPAPFDAVRTRVLAAELAKASPGVVVRSIEDLETLVVATPQASRWLGLNPRASLSVGLAVACISLFAVGGWWRTAPEPASLRGPGIESQTGAQTPSAPSVAAPTEAAPNLAVALADPAPARARPEAATPRRAAAVVQQAKVEVRTPRVIEQAAEVAPIELASAAPVLAASRPQVALRAAPAPDAARPAAPAGGILIAYRSDEALLGPPRANRSDKLVEGGLASLGSEAPQRLASAIAGF